MKRQPGLYDEKNNLIFSWQELVDKGLNIKKDRSTFNISPNTLHLLLKSNNLENVKIKMVLPDGITSIGENAISGCECVTSVELPDTLESIGPYTFWFYKELKSIQIPNKVKSIEHKAFSFCENLSDIKISDSVESIGAFVFTNCMKLEQIRIPESVKSIEPYAFEYCENLKLVEILNPNIRISESIFEECKNLKEIFIYKKVSVNNPYFAEAYKYEIKFFEDMTLDELLDKGHSLIESNEILKNLKTTEER